MTTYDGWSRPRWRPVSEQDLLAAIAAGTLAESHYLEVKREVGKGDSGRRDIARAMASMAVDGGTVLVGLEELKEERSWRLSPQPLEGLADRVDQIAGAAVDPPLYVHITEIAATANTGVGYLVLDVPPSPQAPHMVGGTYYGRAERGRTALSDAQVLRHHERRESTERLVGRLLDEEAARDPQPDVSERSFGRLYAVAQPLTAPRDLALRLISAGDAHGTLRKIVMQAEQHVPQPVRGVPPHPEYFNHSSRRAQGIALSEHSVSGPGRSLLSRSDSRKATDENMLDLELRQDGGLRLLVGRLTAQWGGQAADGEKSFHLILDAHAVAYSLRLVRWATGLAEATGYGGSWVFGVHGTGLRGLISSVQHQQSSSGGSAFDADEYRETTSASRQELAEQPQAVAHRLVGRLLRALATDQYYADLFAVEAA